MKVKYHGCIALRDDLALPKDFVDRRQFKDFKDCFPVDSEGRAELIQVLPLLRSYCEPGRYSFVLFENDDPNGRVVELEEICIQETMFDATT